MKNIMKILMMTVLIFVSAFMVIACGGGSGNEVRVSGSTSVSPVVSKLAASFETTNPEYKIIIESVGSSIGIRDTIENNNEIGMASRNVKPEELQSVNNIVVCNDAIAIVANTSSDVEQISSDELLALYMENKPVLNVSKAISREDGSGTRGAFAELTGVAEDSALPQTVEILDSTGKVKTAVANDEQKLGYISLGSLDDTVKALKYSSDGIDYVVPTVENVKNGTYILYRPFNLVVKKDAELSEGAKAFLEFCKTDDAKTIIIENGYIPLS